MAEETLSYILDFLAFSFNYFLPSFTDISIKSPHPCPAFKLSLKLVKVIKKVLLYI